MLKEKNVVHVFFYCTEESVEMGNEENSNTIRFG